MADGLPVVAAKQFEPGPRTHESENPIPPSAMLQTMTEAVTDVKDYLSRSGLALEGRGVSRSFLELRGVEVRVRAASPVQ